MAFLLATRPSLRFRELRRSWPLIWPDRRAARGIEQLCSCAIDGEIDVVAAGFILSRRVADERGVFSERHVLSVGLFGPGAAVGRAAVFPFRCAVGENFGGFIHGFSFDALESVAGVFVHFVLFRLRVTGPSFVTPTQYQTA